MLKINLFDNNFSHTLNLLGYLTASDFRKPTKLEWQYRNPEYSGVTVFTDFFINDSIKLVKSDYKIIWLLEPQSIHPWAYEQAIKYQDYVDAVFTHDVSFALKNLKNFYLTHVASSRIYYYEEKPKTKLFSMIASNKAMTEGHRFRHEIANKLGNKYNIDLWGSGYKSFNIKNEPLEDYCYTICVMNSKIDSFFTEVIVDPFMTKTIPIVWCTETLKDTFLESGFISFSSIDELDLILDKLDYETYNYKNGVIEMNQKIAQFYVSTDDLIADRIMEFLKDVKTS